MDRPIRTLPGDRTRLIDVFLKVGRAEKHLEDLEALLEPFTKRRTHPVRKSEEPKGKTTKPVFRVQIAGTLPHNDCALIAGDLLHNLRSALDYLAYALNPVKERTRSLYFPLIDRDVWAIDPSTGEYLQTDAGAVDVRASFDRTIKNMDPRAQTIIKGIQPAVCAPVGGQVLCLSILSKLNNSDKHRKLMVTTQGVFVEKLTFSNPATGERGTREIGWDRDNPSADGTEIGIPPGVSPDANMYVIGPVSVAIGNSQDAGCYPCPEVFDDIIYAVKALISNLLAYTIPAPNFAPGALVVFGYALPQNTPSNVDGGDADT